MGLSDIVSKVKNINKPSDVNTPPAFPTDIVQPLEDRKKVDIIIDKQIRMKYQQGWIKKVRKGNITEVVCHATAGSTSAHGIMSWVMGGERAALYNKGIGLFHYLVDRDEPNIVEIIDPTFWVWHSTSGDHDQETIGIEHVNPSMTNRLPLTENQYELSFNLIFNHLLPQYPTIKRIVSHDYNAWKYSGIGPKPCPGPGFDWVRLEKEFLKYKLKFNKIGVGAYEIA